MAIIIGDSQVKYFTEYLTDHRVSCFSKSGIKIEEVLSISEVESAVKNAVVVAIHCGTNNIPHDQPKTILNKYEAVYDKIKKLNPSSKVLISSILPRGDNKFAVHSSSKSIVLEEMNKRATVTNEYLSTVASYLTDVVFVDNNSIFFTVNGETKRHMLSRDGLHLSFEGTENLVANIQKSLTDMLGQEKKGFRRKVLDLNEDTHENYQISFGPYRFSDVVQLKPDVKNCVKEKTDVLNCAKSELKTQNTKRKSNCKKVYSRKSHTSNSKFENAAPKHYNKQMEIFQNCNIELRNRFSVLPIEKTRKCKHKTTVRKRSSVHTVTLKHSKNEITLIELSDKFVLTNDSTLNEQRLTGGGADSEHAEQTKQPTPGKEPPQHEDKNILGQQANQQPLPMQQQVPKTETSGNKIQTSQEPGPAAEIPDKNVYIKIDSPLSHLQALEILLKVDRNKVTNAMPLHPKAGSSYMFSAGLDESKKADWRTDGYRWQNYGNKKKELIIGDQSIVICKKFFKILNGKEADERFQKHVFVVETDIHVSNFCLIIYYGDEAFYQPAPHGNNKTEGSRPFCRTKASVLDKVKEKGDRNPVPVQNAVNAELKASVKENGFSDIRNDRQVKYIQEKLRSNKKLGHDSLYNLYQIYHHLDGYISEIKLAPSVHVIMGLKEIIEEFDKLLQFKTDEYVCLYYDTTFELGDFYVSTVSFQHFLFREKPVIPIAHIIHERKFQSIHESFFSYLKERIPRLRTVNIPIVTDREQAMVNAIQGIFPNLTHFSCWNNFIRDVKDWLKKKGEISENIRVYVSHIKKLLQSASEEEYNQLLNNLEDEKGNCGFRNVWSALFVEYFDKYLDTDLKRSAKYIVEQFDIYNPYSGITNNAAESNNARVKRLLEFKEMDIDCIVLYFFYFQNIDANKIMKGFCNVGDLTLRTQYKHIQHDVDSIQLNEVVHPNNLIQLLRGEMELTQDSPPHSVSNAAENMTNAHNSGEEQTKTETVLPKTAMSQESLANKVLLDKGIALVPDLCGFMVKGVKGKLYAVRLFPSESCQCPSATRCYHIIAAMRSIGMHRKERKRLINLNRLAKRSRKKNDKRSGRKKPRIGDLDDTVINPAPDSISVTRSDTDYVSDSDSDLDVSFVKTPNSTSKKLSQTPVTDKKRTENTKSQTPRQSHTPKTPKSILKNKVTPAKPGSSRKNLRFSSQEDMNVCNSDEEFISLDTPLTPEDNTDTNKEPIWKEELHLKHQDKKDIENDKKLNSGHIEAVNILLRRQFKNMNGLQLPQKVPYFDKKQERWHVHNLMEPVSVPACQIHHTHSDHWVVSFKEENGDVFIFDSLGTDRPDGSIIPDGLKIQLCTLYAGNKSELNVTIPETQRQTGNVNFGVFAIAHAVSFCINGKTDPCLTFDTNQFRTHLVSCLEKEFLTEFPLTTLNMNLRRKREPKAITIQNICVCNLPECVDLALICKICKMKFHKSCCVQDPDAVIADGEFCCTFCDS